jgi:hypothetical protein
VSINLATVVGFILTLMCAGAIFGLLFFLIHYIGRKPFCQGEMAQMFVSVADIILVVLGVLVLIGLFLSLAGVGPDFHWGNNPPPVVR